MNYRPAQQNRAFTLVETMVAISIMMLAILGPLSIAASGLRNALFARDQITAYYLAQEGIEYVRYVRDNNYINYVKNDPSTTWTYGLDNCIIAGSKTNGCKIDMYDFFYKVNFNYTTIGTSQYQPTYCSDANCSPAMNLNTSGYYTYIINSGSLSPFRRVIKITMLSANEMKVQVTMSWQTGVTPKTFTITENIFNIY